MLKSENYLTSFYYPKREGKWHFEWPWNIYNSWWNWFFRYWEGENGSKTSKYQGIIILGWKKIDTTWTCPPKRALKEWQEGNNRLVRWLEALVNED